MLWTLWVWGMRGFLEPGTFSANAGEFQALGKSPILEDPPLHWVLGLLWVGGRKVLLPWSSQSMGQGYESGRTDTAAEPPRKKWGSGRFPVGHRSGLPTVPQASRVCVLGCVCVKGASPLLLCTAEMRVSLPCLDGEGGREHFLLSPTRAWSSGCALGFCSLCSGCWCGSVGVVCGDLWLLTVTNSSLTLPALLLITARFLCLSQLTSFKLLVRKGVLLLAT